MVVDSNVVLESGCVKVKGHAVGGQASVALPGQALIALVTIGGDRHHVGALAPDDVLLDKGQSATPRSWLA